MRTGALGEGLFVYTWSFAICPFRVSIGLSVVEGLEQDMAARAEPRHGVLFGRKTAGITHIDSWHSVPALDREAMSAVKPPVEHQVVGFYTLREGSAFMLSPAEVAIANELFNQLGSVMLLVERRKKGSPEATFYFSRTGTFVHNLPLPFPFNAGILSGETPKTAVIPVIPAGVPALSRQSQGRTFRTGLVGVMIIAAAGLLAAYFREGQPRARRPAIESGPPSEAAQWIRTEPRRDLELTWDSKANPVLMATAGVLRIEDGGVLRQMSLDAGELLMGAILYAPASDHIRVELTTLQRDGRTLQMPVIAHAPQPASSSDADFSVPPPGTLPKGNLVDEARRPSEELAARKNDPIPAPAGSRTPLKRFTLTASQPAPPAANLPAMPDIAPHVAPPVVNPALAATLPAETLPAPVLPAAPAAPPKAAPAPGPVRPVVRSGRLIWTGTLQRRGIVELDGRSVSVGSLNGALPGVPVSLSITPAEFGDDGLVVYTTESALNNRVEPPSAGNGWNKLKFVWDPERVKQISTLETPNENNGFNRLTIRSDARRCSMLLIDWTLK